MQKTVLQRLQFGILGLVGVLLMLAFSACQGVTGTVSGNNGSGSINITGSIQSVSAANHSVTINVNGQSYTITGLSDQQVQALQSQVGKVYNLQANFNGSAYVIAPGSQPQEDDNGTPGVNNTPEGNQGGQNGQGQIVPGYIQFVGHVQSVNGNSVTVLMPNGQGLAMSITPQTNESDNLQLAAGQLVSVEADVNTLDGSFTAAKIKLADSGDQQDANVVEFEGVTTGAVSNNTISFKVGNKSYSYQIGVGADLGDFNNNAQSIQANQNVKVKVLFNGTSGTVTKVSNANS
jgi:hypothetical protein